jgi:hypothetical protein
VRGPISVMAIGLALLAVGMLGVVLWQVPSTPISGEKDRREAHK